MTQTVWTYGDEGTAFPVEYGQVWECAGHTFLCSDLMASKAFDRLLADTEHLKLLYSDPPWGQSLVNSFRTKAGLERAEYRWEDLYARIALLGHERGLPVYVEASKAEHRDGKKVPGTITSPLGPSHHAYWEVVYYGDHPSGLFYNGKVPPPAALVDPDPLTGVDDDYTPAIVMSAYSDHGVVIDPCAGRGVTSRQAHDAGWTSVNNELNPHRVSAALARMANHSGSEPRRVS